MCGICGKIANHIDKRILEEMTDAMYDRGPNAKGTYIASVAGREVGLGHRRLSIFDTSEGANQPFISDDGKYVVVYNGEIYNFKEIREELKGHCFHTSCDTEVLLHAFIEWGIGAVDKFNGMFAFAILDKESEKLILCRDRLGVKPLYYSLQGDEFFFASDLAALLKDPTYDKYISKKALHYYLWNMCIPAPFSIFENTYKLGTGEYLELDLKELKYEKKKFWDIYIETAKATKSKQNEEDILSETEKYLIEAVKMRLEADVPVGVFLSGGIDSSLVTAIASKLRGGDIDTFSIGFNEKEFDEAGYAEDIAKHLGTRHHSLYCSIEDAKDLIWEIPKAYSEPFADNSQIPMMLLSKLTRDNVTVALSGDGGDEFFLGYPTVIRNADLYGNRAINRVISAVTAPVSSALKGAIYSHKAWKVNKLRNATDAEKIINLDYYTAEKLIDSVLMSDSVSEEKLTQSSEFSDLNGLYSNCSNRVDFIDAQMLHDMTLGLEGDMLAKVDRATMHYSLEARCPLLDYHVVEESFKIPFDLKYKDKSLKYVLKSILYKYVPKELVDRPKQGFGIPINKWLHEPEFMNGFENYFTKDFLEKQGVFSYEGICSFKEAFNRNAGPMVDRIMWTYLVFQMWWEEYIG